MSPGTPVTPTRTTLVRKALKHYTGASGVTSIGWRGRAGGRGFARERVHDGASGS